MPLTPGSRLGHYEVIALIGSGGMGTVYRARDLRLGRDVAVKVMSTLVAHDPEMRRRFETEVQAIATLSHPGILEVHELAVVDGVPVAVMELLAGENLRDRIVAGPCPWRVAAGISAAIAEGLAAAHARGVVHRDLKPENIFLCSNGNVKILDFGLALLRRARPEHQVDDRAAPQPANGGVLGTFGYMSPEQVTGGHVDGRSDLFALGCVLYEMLTGERLFAGKTPQAMLARLLQATPPDLDGIDLTAPVELRAIIARCVEREPASRFQTAEELGIALRAVEGVDRPLASPNGTGRG